MTSLFSNCKKRTVDASGKQILVGPPIVHYSISQIELCASVFRGAEELSRKRCKILASSSKSLLKVIQESPAVIIINWPPIIGIYQTKIPKLRTLVDIGNPGQVSFSSNCANALIHP
jgi:hypothetical protein